MRVINVHYLDLVYISLRPVLPFELKNMQSSFPYVSDVHLTKFHLLL